MGALLSQLMLDRDEGDYAMTGEAQLRHAHVYVKQSFSWDCGVACASMAQRWACCSSNSNSNSSSSDFGLDTGPRPAQSMSVSKATPLWTVDIYCFLRGGLLGLAGGPGLPFSAAFSTDVPGLNTEHSSLVWYQSHLEDDRSRVDKQFQLAAQQGWEVDAAVCTEDLVQMFALDASAAAAAASSTSGEDVSEDAAIGASADRSIGTNSIGTSGGGAIDATSAAGGGYFEERGLAAIVLVNNLHLARDFRNGGAAAPSADAYSGHYVFLLGFDSRCGDALYLDPAKDGSLRKCTARLFAQARDSPGTDRDMVLLRRRRQ